MTVMNAPMKFDGLKSDFVVAVIVLRQPLTIAIFRTESRKIICSDVTTIRGKKSGKGQSKGY